MYIVYFYDKSGACIWQAQNIFNLNIEKNLNDISTCSFSMHYNNPYCNRDYINNYRKIKIKMLLDDWEKTMFEWVIRWYPTTLEYVTIKAESYEHIIDRRYLHDSFSFSLASVDSIVNTLLSHINWIWDTGIKLDCWIEDQINISFQFWESLLKCLQKLIKYKAEGYEFKIEDWILYFKNSIGIDRSSWDDYLEYKYDLNELDDRTIDQIFLESDWKEFCSWVYWKVDWNYIFIEDEDTVNEHWLIEDILTNDSPDIATIESHLYNHKYMLSEFSIKSIAKNFFEADLGDIVKVYVFSWNDLLYYNWTLKIIWKSYSSWDLEKINFILSKNNIKTKDIITQIKDIQNNLHELQLKTL